MTDMTKNEKDFPELESQNNRPVTWDYTLDKMVSGEMTNVVTIYSNECPIYDESGQFPNVKFTGVTLTRSELQKMLDVLDDDMAKMKEHNPDHTFV
jgi:hypothetical protein